MVPAHSGGSLRTAPDDFIPAIELRLIRLDRLSSAAYCHLHLADPTNGRIMRNYRRPGILLHLTFIPDRSIRLYRIYIRQSAVCLLSCFQRLGLADRLKNRIAPLISADTLLLDRHRILPFGKLPAEILLAEPGLFPGALSDPDSGLRYHRDLRTDLPDCHGQCPAGLVLLKIYPNAQMALGASDYSSLDIAGHPCLRPDQRTLSAQTSGKYRAQRHPSRGHPARHRP